MAASFDNLALEIKICIILYLPNPLPLAKCSRAWHTLVNSPTTKSKWLISMHGKVHALFHAVRIGEPFISADVVECLLAQNAHLSRYFTQKLVLGFGKYDSKLANAKKELDSGEELIQIKNRCPWASNLFLDVFTRILEEAHRRYDGNDIPIRGNDMESFYYLSAGSFKMSQAQKVLETNMDEIKTLIKRYKFAPLPPRPKVRSHISKNLVFESCEDSFTDGYENLRNLTVITRAILVCPELLNIWKENGYYEIVEDTNDIAIRGSLLALYPSTPSDDWVKPDLDQVVTKLSDLQSCGYKVTDDLLGDVMILLEQKLDDIGDVLVNAFAVVCHRTKQDTLSICLRELLNPARDIKLYHSLEFVINAIDDPEEEILAAFEEYGIENPIEVDLDSISEVYTIHKYSPIVYEYMLAKFGADSRVSRYLMNEITAARIRKAKLCAFNSSLALSSVRIDCLWAELDYIFNVYCKGNVPWKPQLLPLLRTCPSERVIECLFSEGYLPELFGFQANDQLPRSVSNQKFHITPFTQTIPRKCGEVHNEKTEWMNAILHCNQNNNITIVFRNQLDNFLQRLHTFTEEI
ncbi:9532_t:CDS:1 [Paraglomus brasilianum]|uniref:9532_t:CDS:1 n=1 Tax=Paraglomus brasilianum TaxID=144538 RepID=A0A9N9FPA0_9GLOM|nr:9532_t:CDS:1 [Paraglomus brasilianum]